MSKPETTREIEAKLILVGVEGRAAFEEAARAHDLAMEAVAGAEPSRRSLCRLELHDRYFDLDGDSLRERDSGLRLRDGGGPTLLTFKGPADVRDLGLVDRLELEGEWSQNILVRILDHLATVGVHLPPAVPFDEPEATLVRLGFRHVHSRRTVRREALLRDSAPGLRELMHEGDASGAPNVVVALDEVHYQTSARSVVHREVEFEARDSNAAASLSNLRECLYLRMQRQGDAERRESFSVMTSRFLRVGPIRPWKWSKTALGAELERLEQEGQLEVLVEGDALTSEGYVEVDRRLSRSSPASRRRWKRRS